MNLPSVVRDQNDVVWFDGGMMSRQQYENIRQQYPEVLLTFEKLPLWDSHDQNVVDVDK